MVLKVNVAQFLDVLLVGEVLLFSVSQRWLLWLSRGGLWLQTDDVLPSPPQGEEAAPNLEPEQADSSPRSYSMEELLNDLTKSDQARLLFHSLPSYSLQMLLGFQSFILVIYSS